MTAVRKVLIEITSDTICPWCYVGKRRLEAAIARAPKTLEFDIVYKPFFLNPSLPAEGTNKLEMYESKFGKERVAKMLETMKHVGNEVGIKFDYGGLTANTMDSHRLLEYAKQHNKQLPLVEKLFSAYFEQTKNIGDRDVLASVAAEVGFDKAEVLAYLNSDEGDGTHEVVEQVESAQRRRITGVPFFRINRTYDIGGAQEPETFVEIFEKIASDSA
ncbi:thioredoxin-like protein [Powellomyces hirtus]|nr:thioredoxin-like protein [Powellomyces hirtus]